MHKLTTLVFVRRGDEILLGMKKRGFGEGRWNGFGGKIEPEETPLEGAKRELLEESGVTGKVLKKVGHLVFDFEVIPDTVETTVYLCDDFSGVPSETSEMSPRWFPAAQLPYETMWVDDKYWIPLILKGQQIEAIFHFKGFDELKDFTITEKQA